MEIPGAKSQAPETGFSPSERDFSCLVLTLSKARDTPAWALGTGRGEGSVCLRKPDCQASAPGPLAPLSLEAGIAQRAGLAPRVLPAVAWLLALSCPLWAVGGVSEFVLGAYKQKLFLLSLFHFLKESGTDLCM